MSAISARLRWTLLSALRPYLRNPVLDRGKWFLLHKLNPIPGEEQDWLRFGTRRFKTRYGALMQGHMLYCSDRQLYFSGEHFEFPLMRIAHRILGPGWRFIDAGANVGVYTLFAARQAREVYSFEPNPETLGLLRANLALNESEHVTLFECGLSDESHSAVLHQAGRNIGGATLQERGSASTEHAIEVVRGDDRVSAESPLRTYLKVDVEGLEFRVLRGFRQLLKQPSVVVQVEITDRWLRRDGGSAEALFAWMGELGFTPYRVRAHTRVRTRCWLERIPGPLDERQYSVLFTKHADAGTFWRWVNS